MNAETDLSRPAIIRLLSMRNEADQEALIKSAYALKAHTVGKKVHLRGLIEISNHCRKNCLYCGIRSGNENVARYSMPDEEILQVVSFAEEKHLTGIAIQAGEVNTKEFIDRITRLIQKIKKTTYADFRITLSLGEQTLETYRKWFDAGAQRYLLRIETSSPTLYKKIHPKDGLHDFQTRLRCLEDLQQIGYQTGTGVMIGLPFQTLEHLADDLLFIKEKDMDMVGMGPYLEHSQTPLYQYKALLMPLMDRFHLSLRMMAVLRMLMPYINIVSTTALQVISPVGRELGLKAGANVLMPNLTPARYRNGYQLYEKKPCLNETADECLVSLAGWVERMGEQIAGDEYGDSAHYLKRIKQQSQTN